LDRIIQEEEETIAGSTITTATTATANGSTTTAPPPPTPKKPRLRAPAHSLPYYTTHLLIAAYLASYNPSRTDVTYFMKHTDKRKNKRRVHSTSLTTTKSKHRKIPRHLLTPSPFPLDRLLAIFRGLIDGTVPQVADILAQVSTLASMRLLVRVGAVGSADVLDTGARWRVNFGWEFVRSLGREVGLEVGEYLVGGVD
jgi:origin recognition complex subunit 5